MEPRAWIFVLGLPYPCPHVLGQGSVQACKPSAAGDPVQSLSPAALCATGMPVVHSGQTVPGQAPLCFDPGSPASDRTEGKKKGRPKAENQALRDIPVSFLSPGGAYTRSAHGGQCPALNLLTAQPFPSFRLGPGTFLSMCCEIEWTMSVAPSIDLEQGLNCCCNA